MTAFGPQMVSPQAQTPSEQAEVRGPVIHSFQKFEEVVQAASTAAMVSMSIMAPAMLYKQGNRYFLLTTFNFQTLIRHVRYDSAPKGDDPELHINRPFMAPHGKDISEYLCKTTDYILPPLALNTQDPLPFYTIDTPSQVRLGFIVIPTSLEFDVTDGQHRGNAVKDAIDKRKSLGQDGIGVTISTETDREKIHQDFVDCAKNKPISPAMLAAFDHANLVVRYVNETIRKVPFLTGRVDRSAARLGKNTIKVFTLNQLQTALLEFLVGRVPPKDQIAKVGEERLKEDAQMAAHVGNAATFLNDFTDANPEWRQVTASNTGTGEDAYEQRQTRLHFNASGLVVIGKVGHAIYTKTDQTERTRLTRLLAGIDWSRSNPFWQNSIMNGDKIVTSRDMFTKATAAVKKELGLELTDAEKRLLG